MVGASNEFFVSESPSFQATKNDNSRGQYTQTDEENTTLTPGNSKHNLRRRRSHLQRWIEDQQYHTHAGPDDASDILDDTESPVPTIGTPCNPYLAYPHLGVASSHPRTLNEVGSLHNYVVVDDIPDEGDEVEEDRASVDSEGAEVRFSKETIILFLTHIATAHVATTFSSTGCLPANRIIVLQETRRPILFSSFPSFPSSYHINTRRLLDLFASDTLLLPTPKHKHLEGL